MNIGKYTSELSGELRLKNYSENSIRLYVDTVTRFLHDFEAVYDKPKDIPSEVIKQWLRESPSQSLLRIRIGALKNFYQRVIKQPLKFKYIEYPRKEKRIPIILDHSEVQLIFDNLRNSKHKCITLILYSTGIRVSELINLKIQDIDPYQMVIYIKQGKGKKDRIVPLKSMVWDYIQKYMKEYNPKEYLFNGQFDLQYSDRSINQFLQDSAKRSGITKRVYAHLFRHTALTGMLESGDDLHVVQRNAGHNKPSTTSIYLHLSPKTISNSANHINSLNI